MFTAADVIAYLGQRRRLRSIRPEIPGQLPPGWQAWLDAMPTADAAVMGALAPDIIDVLAQRELARPPRRAAQLNRWQAFAMLWRQQWQPRIREERGTHWFATLFSGGLHVVLIAMLLWLAWVRIEPLPPASEGETVVQVEFIGRGTPREQGGGTPAGSEPATEPAASAQASAAAPAPAAAAPPQPAPTEPSPETQAATPAAPQPEPPAPQPLQVTEVAQPDIDFVLPPPTPREITLPQRQLTVPEARQPQPRIAEVERPQPAPLQMERPQAQVQPSLQLRVEPQPVEPEPAARLPQVQARPVDIAHNPQLRVPDVQSRLRDLPTRHVEPAPVQAQGTQPAAATSQQGTTQPAPGSATVAAPPSAAPGAQRAETGGAGPVTAAKPGAWPTPSQADDWGASSRNRPGAQAGTPGGKPGLFDAQGRPRLVDEPSPTGNAPGTVEQRIADLDRAGTWLKRPPYDYTPTVFDKYWRPRETLLQEWVRKGIKKLSIPIPGTDKKLECVVSILQFGGGCGISDPNRNEQPASARPPPDIPFKPELQEDNGSVKP